MLAIQNCIPCEGRVAKLSRTTPSAAAGAPNRTFRNMATPSPMAAAMRDSEAANAHLSDKPVDRIAAFITS